MTHTQWITWNVTELAAAWLSSPAGNHGVALDSAQVFDHQVGFNSRENGLNPPRLTILYVRPTRRAAASAWAATTCSW